uniref:Peptidase M16 N-terminal domain-containing protein n=1 Tax=Chromera velia CCMP2878 TaxID=1169474 RepID=A0A0G4FVA0_9ALVE|eukprot:Cvel_18852.t1-p1 / transcript=Cvel_18852.t1 / gene=Cvel_18852 / organism=Chromera_velia_CCMP2878 / gene_product=Insulin-degrading enzyme, putative / transcript_product=Insulin-degrading enzyme, putative / location=Cvel_scaffold1585:18134-28933(+) / protein_length=1279 / sequence_SO=supercontig / SO=protein_coding / is_pseudo=false
MRASVPPFLFVLAASCLFGSYETHARRHKRRQRLLDMDFVSSPEASPSSPQKQSSRGMEEVTQPENPPVLVSPTDVRKFHFILHREDFPDPDNSLQHFQHLSLEDDKKHISTVNSNVQALIVEDAEEDHAAAAVCVRTGHYSDPEEKPRPGLAHFCEHMLFMGNKKLSENEFQDFLAKNGGSSNAFTSGSETCYYFTLATAPQDDETKKTGSKKSSEESDHSGKSEEAFLEALGMFASFFFEHSKFDSSAVEREVHAVDQEHAKNKQADVWRGNRAMGVAMFNQDHPRSKFGTGDIDTLWSSSSSFPPSTTSVASKEGQEQGEGQKRKTDKKGVKRDTTALLIALEEFFEKWYTPFHMSVSVVSKFPREVIRTKLESLLTYGSQEVDKEKGKPTDPPDYIWQGLTVAPKENQTTTSSEGTCTAAVEPLNDFVKDLSLTPPLVRIVPIDPYREYKLVWVIKFSPEEEAPPSAHPECFHKQRDKAKKETQERGERGRCRGNERCPISLTRRQFDILRPDRYLSHVIGYEGRKSFSFLLRQLDLANSVVVGLDEREADYATFSISVKASQKGWLQRNDQLTQLLFQYLKYLKLAAEGPGATEQHPLLDTFKELLLIEDFAFDFWIPDDSEDLAISLAYSGVSMPRDSKLWVAGDDKAMLDLDGARHWDPRKDGSGGPDLSLITKYSGELLDLLTPESVIVVETAGEDEDDPTEDDSGTGGGPIQTPAARGTSPLSALETAGLVSSSSTGFIELSLGGPGSTPVTHTGETTITPDMHRPSPPIKQRAHPHHGFHRHMRHRHYGKDSSTPISMSSSRLAPPSTHSPVQSSRGFLHLDQSMALREKESEAEEGELHWRTEKFYNVEFAVSRMSRRTLEGWQNANRCSQNCHQWSLPGPNKYLTAEASLRAQLDSTFPPDKRRAVYEQMKKGRSRKDKVEGPTLLKDPNAQAGADAESLPGWRALSRLYHALLSDHLLSSQYDAALAGLHFGFELGALRGPSLSVSGWADMDRMKAFLREMATATVNFRYYADLLLTEVSFSVDEVREEVERATLEEVEAYSRTVFGDLWAEGLVQGAVSEKDALDLVHIVDEVFEVRKTRVPFSRQAFEHVKQLDHIRTLSLPKATPGSSRPIVPGLGKAVEVPTVIAREKNGTLAIEAHIFSALEKNKEKNKQKMPTSQKTKTIKKRTLEASEKSKVTTSPNTSAKEQPSPRATGLLELVGETLVTHQSSPSSSKTIELQPLHIERDARNPGEPNCAYELLFQISTGTPIPVEQKGDTNTLHVS